MDLPGVEVPDSDAEGSACRATAGTGNVERRCDWSDCGRTFAPSRPNQRFCGLDCKNAFHDLHRPRIASAVVGHPREGTIKAALLGVLHDREWHTAHDLAAKVKADKHSIISRISELRAAGFKIETDLPLGNSRRPHRVRLQP